MRIAKITIQNLFGVFNHAIPMNMEHRLTIIYGLNGYGKTIILRMTHDLLKGNYQIFRKIPFDRFKLDFDNGDQISIIKDYGEPAQQQLSFNEAGFDAKAELPKPTYELNISALLSGKHRRISKIPGLTPRDLKRFPPSFITEILPELRRVDIDTWRHNDGRILSIQDIADIYGDRLISILPIGRSDKKNELEPSWLKELRSQVDIHLIEADRLFSSSSTLSKESFGRKTTGEYKPKLSVEEYSDEIVGIIKTTVDEYGELTQSLDRTYPMRLMKEGRQLSLDTESLQRKLETLKEERARLMNLGLLDQDTEDQNLPSIDREDETFILPLSIYVQDIEKKLSVFNIISHKLELLKDIIDRRFSYSYKSLKIDKNRGFIFLSSNGNTIPPTDLSSGEQHELTLLYQLLFHIQQNSLILIDEPELSLHVIWQRQFLSDIERITELSKFDLLIATHSPQIISDRDDLTVALVAPEGAVNEP